MKIIDSTLFVGVYGSFNPHPGIDPDADAYSLFVSRATAMRWLSFNAATTTKSLERRGLWGMNDAGQDWTGSSARIAWYQVGVGEGRPLPVQPLLACAGDSLARAGTIDLQAVQLLLPVQVAADATADLASAARQFSPGDPERTPRIVMTVDSGESNEIPRRAEQILAALTVLTKEAFGIHRVGVLGDADLLTEVTRRQNRPAPAVVDEFWLGDGHHGIALDGVLPEWSFDAIGWIAEAITEACRRSGVQTTVLVTIGRP
jgi:hypothetical protein